MWTVEPLVLSVEEHRNQTAQPFNWVDDAKKAA
jgi:hypothetical protein